MAITITVTVGSATANSFASETEFIALMATRLNVPSGTTVTGTTASETEKKALIEATRELSNPTLPWAGTRVDTTQVLPWPREYAPKPDLPDDITVGTSYYYLTTEIPSLLKDAQIELAMEFIKAGTTDVAARDSLLDVRREKVDVLETEYFAQAERARGLARFPRVLALITPLFDETKVGAMTVARC